jgi:dihydrofolate reductase
MIISIIAAMDEIHGIGIDNKLPWRLSDDLTRFKELTMGHHIIMGRKTFETIGKALPERVNIIVTRNRDFQVPGCLVAHSPEDAIEMARSQGDDEVFVIGGSRIFQATIGIADKFYLTTVHTEGNADTFFPEFNLDDWQVEYSESFPADESNEFPTPFKVLQKKF